MPAEPKKDAAVPDATLTAFTQIVTAIRELDKAEQYAVLHVAAKYCGCAIKVDVS